jgi:predicted dithiol-disulfide oxidoreductase (DUF899 family)
VYDEAMQTATNSIPATRSGARRKLARIEAAMTEHRDEIAETRQAMPGSSKEEANEMYRTIEAITADLDELSELSDSINDRLNDRDGYWA